MRHKQPPLFNEFKEIKKHGGELAKGKAKTKRPFTRKKPIHAVMRSSIATGTFSLRRHASFIQTLLTTLSKKFGVKLYSYSINSNHLHLVVKGESREGFQNFFRSLSGIIARKVSGAERGKPLKERFWQGLFFTRILEWGRDFKNGLKYVLKNELEASGAIAYAPRKRNNPRTKPPP